MMINRSTWVGGIEPNPHRPIVCIGLDIWQRQIWVYVDQVDLKSYKQIRFLRRRRCRC